MLLEGAARPQHVWNTAKAPFRTRLAGRNLWACDRKKAGGVLFRATLVVYCSIASGWAR
jgi:hypothetical protein